MSSVQISIVFSAAVCFLLFTSPLFKLSDGIPLFSEAMPSIAISNSLFGNFSERFSANKSHELDLSSCSRQLRRFMLSTILLTEFIKLVDSG